MSGTQHTALANSTWNAEDQQFMMAALSEARNARQMREVPVGCVIVRDGHIIGRGHNMTNAKRNGTRHAEFEAIDGILQDAGGDVKAAGFDRCTLYVTVEPCIMCAGALSTIGIKEVVFGAGNDRFGGCGSILSIHEQGCGQCGSGLPMSGGSDDEGKPNEATALAATYPVRRGLFADEAIELLQDFYAAGNPAAPRPHRPIRGT